MVAGLTPNTAYEFAVRTSNAIDTAPVGRLTKVTDDALFGPTAARTSANTYTNGSILTDPAGGKFLRHSIPAGQLGPLIVSPKLSRDVEHAVLDYDIRFDENFDWRWDGKIPGLVGVAPGQGIYAPTSGSTNRSAGFSTRLMWHGRGDDGSRPFQGKLGPIPAGTDNELVSYVYAPDPSAGFGGYGWHSNLRSEMQRGQWHHITMEVKLNAVGSRNGVLNIWGDGRLQFSASDWEFRTRSDVKINAVCMTSTEVGAPLRRAGSARGTPTSTSATWWCEGSDYPTHGGLPTFVANAHPSHPSSRAGITVRTMCSAIANDDVAPGEGALRR